MRNRLREDDVMKTNYLLTKDPFGTCGWGHATRDLLVAPG
jgi:hypothetical protein